jgi:hypothetical protein
MKVGHITYEKDTCLVLDNTIGLHLNDGLKKIVNKHILIGRVAQDRECNVSRADEDLANDDNGLDFFLSLCLFRYLVFYLLLSTAF